jgi:hypothetical protein
MAWAKEQVVPYLKQVTLSTGVLSLNSICAIIDEEDDPGSKGVAAIESYFFLSNKHSTQDTTNQSD